jgi:hypothetical protein
MCEDGVTDSSQHKSERSNSRADNEPEHACLAMETRVTPKVAASVSNHVSASARNNHRLEGSPSDLDHVVDVLNMYDALR